MEYRKMGKTGLQLSVLSYGSWVTFNNNSAEMQDKLMSLAYEQGVNFFDNAEVYANGESEIVMGKILKKKNWERSSFVVSSKAFWGWHGKDTKPNQNGLCRKHLIEACHEALQRLQVDYLDLFFCHRPDKSTPIEEVVWTMNLLMQQGKILYWGTSEWSGVEIMEAHRVAQQYKLIAPVVEQPQYNLFVREKMENEFLQIFKNNGLGTTIWSPLASGVLSGKYNDGMPDGSRLAVNKFDWLNNMWLKKDVLDRVKKLAELAKELNTTTATLAIAWCIQNKNVTTAILGATNENQLKENLKALELYPKLTPEINNRIEEIVKTKPVLPEY